MNFDPLNWFAFGWFLSTWVGYSYYTKYRAKSSASLSAMLYQYRIEWVKNLLLRDNRVVDMALLSNLSKTVNFFASTTIFVIAGVLTVLYSSHRLVELLSGHDFMYAPTKEQIQFKLIVLLFIFVFAFFRFTWSMRQHTFCSILFGAAPHMNADDKQEERDLFAKQIAKVSDRARHEFNYGLHAYYFALAVLTWFISPWLFIPACTIVVLILYRREFHSGTLQILVDSRKAREDL